MNSYYKSDNILLHVIIPYQKLISSVVFYSTSCNSSFHTEIGGCIDLTGVVIMIFDP